MVNKTAKTSNDVTIVKTRISVLDFIRGAMLISMIAYHTIWNLTEIFGVEISVIGTVWGTLWQQSICWTFILLSGFCVNLGSHNLKRGIIVFISGGLVTLITGLIMPENIVIFGILTFIGSAMIIVALLDKCLQKINPIIGLITASFLLIILWDINTGNIGFEGIATIRMPKFIYHDFFTTFLGLPFKGFFSTDYFPILPWLFLFIAGYYIGRICIDYDLMKKIPDIKFAPLNFLGKHSLIVYLLHQPIIYLVLKILFMI